MKQVLLLIGMAVVLVLTCWLLGPAKTDSDNNWQGDAPDLTTVQNLV